MAPLVPESVLKKRRQQEAGAAKDAANTKASQKKAASSKRKAGFKRAEQFVRDFRAQANDARRARRVVRHVSSGRLPPPAEATLVVAVRLRGGATNVSVKARAALKALRLPRPDTAVFLRLDARAAALLRLVEPFVAWGAPTLAVVRDLVSKRAFGRGRGGRARVALSDNTVVEEALGAQGMLCVEDLVHEIFTLGEHFDAVMKFLFPFALAHATGRFQQETLRESLAGKTGDRGADINDVLRKMI